MTVTTNPEGRGKFVKEVIRPSLHFFGQPGRRSRTKSDAAVYVCTTCRQRKQALINGEHESVTQASQHAWMCVGGAASKQASSSSFFFFLFSFFCCRMAVTANAT